MTLSLPKLQCYAKFVFHGITGKTRNKVKLPAYKAGLTGHIPANNFEQFHRQKGPKLAKN
jgi:hypothetical protein